MIQKQFKIIDEAGLHARPASILTKTATSYSGEVTIVYKNKRYLLRSVMILMSLGIPKDGEFTIEVHGQGEEEIMAKLTNILVDNNLV